MTVETPEALRAALAENERRPYGLPRTTTAESIVAAAEPFDDPALLADALLQLMTAYEFAGEQRKAPVAFAQLLELLDGSPDAFDERRTFAVLWQFKWVIAALIQVPDVPLTAIEQLIDRMADRYRAAGHGQQPVAAVRHRLAAHTGIGLTRAYELWVTRPRERLTDCAACETRRLALHHLDAGDDELALATLDPVLAGESSCAEEPQTSASHALLPLLRAGRVDDARSHHLTAYRKVRGVTGMLAEIGEHLRFCALSGNEPRGLEVLSDSRPLFAATGAPLDRLDFLTGVEVLLRRLTEAGHGGLAVPGPAGTEWTAAGLADHVGAEADELAAAFDARNGTGHVGDRRRARLAQEPVNAAPVPLGLRAARPLPAAAAPAATGEAPAAGEDLAALVARGRRLMDQGHPDQLAVWERVAALVEEAGPASPEPDDRLRADLAAHRAHRELRDGDRAAALAAVATAAELYTAAGLAGRARTHQARALTLRETPAADDATWAELADLIAADAAEHPAPEPGSEAARTRLHLLNTRTFLAFRPLIEGRGEPPAGARERFAEANATLLSEATRLAVPHQVASAHRYAADVAAHEGRWEAAVVDLRACLDALEAADRPWGTPMPQFLLAQVLRQQGRPEEAVDLAHRALAGAARHGDPDFPTAVAHTVLGGLSAQTGDLTGAITHLSQAADRFERDGDHDGAAGARFDLSEALARAGQHAEAATVLESALDADPDRLDPRLAAQLRLSLGHRLTAAGEHRAAAEEFLRLADTLASWEEDRHLHTMAAGEAATALLRAGSTEAADAAYRRMLSLHETAPHPEAVLGAARAFADRAAPDEALAHLATADGLVPALPPEARWYETGVNRDLRARVLARAGRPEEALSAAESAVAAFAEGGQDGERARAEASRVAAVLEADQLDRRDAALARLAETIGRCRAAGDRETVEILERLRARIAG
ncbi:tetratricopeptide repeat protein [Streptomyces sp. NPDC127098]|uniref:tetratricopeptide repeat protein n=1 Tax=Streptomyces sp. NPDC127098 TaxID=3347137 RepID=UPI00365F8D62